MNERDESTRRLRPSTGEDQDGDEYSATALDVGWSPPAEGDAASARSVPETWARPGGPERISWGTPAEPEPDAWTASAESVPEVWAESARPVPGRAPGAVPPVQDAAAGSAPPVQFPGERGAHPVTRQDVRRDAGPPSAAAAPAPPQGPATGEVLRFGPGVPRRNAAADVWQAGAPADRTPVTKRRGWPPYLLAALVLIAVAGFLAWQRFGVPLRVQSVAVAAPARGPRCDGTAVITATVAVNGRPGTIRYRWWRSDGTRSGPLTEQVSRGQREAKLQLRWSFRGRGRVDARAELRVVAPQRRVSSAEFTYACP